MRHTITFLRPPQQIRAAGLAKKAREEEALRVAKAKRKGEAEMPLDPYKVLELEPEVFLFILPHNNPLLPFTPPLPRILDHLHGPPALSTQTSQTTSSSSSIKFIKNLKGH